MCLLLNVKVEEKRSDELFKPPLHTITQREIRICHIATTDLENACPLVANEPPFFLSMRHIA
jgi:hypothetical protein